MNKFEAFAERVEKATDQLLDERGLLFQRSSDRLEAIRWTLKALEHDAFEPVSLDKIKAYILHAKE